MAAASIDFATRNERRRMVLETIRVRPGLGFRELARACDLPHGSLSYHTSVLSRAGLIWTTGHGPRRVHFPGNRPPEAEVRDAIIQHALDPFERRILEFIRGARTVVQKVILDADWGRPKSSVQHHLYRLRTHGLIQERRSGRFVVYEEAFL